MPGEKDEGAQPCARCSGAIPVGAAFCPHCGAGTTAVAVTGPVLPGFTILRTLGQGGAAVVYLARQESLEREVAVKVLRHDVEEPRVWRQFQREARTIARLSGHPHVVHVYTAGRSEAGQPFLVTEYVDRGSLSDVIRTEGPLPPAVVARIGVALADALIAAHALGILHRDVKPGNVLLDHDGRVKLGDFGIARLIAAQATTTTDVVAFTPEHVAPEILQGEQDGPSSDVYGLGSTLAAAVTGQALFTRRPDERVEALLARKLMGPPPTLPASVPAGLAGAIGAALDRDPARRPSLVDLRARLDAAATEVPAIPPPPASPPVASLGSVAEQLRDRRRRRLVVVPVLLLALIGAAVLIALLARNAGDAASPATSTAESTAPTGTAAAPVATLPAATPPPTLAPTSAAPTTAAPTSAAPSTAPAAVVTSTPAAPVTTPPAATAPVVTLPTSLPAPVFVPPPPIAAPTIADEPVLVSAEEAERFVGEYYDAVREGDYDASWSQLAPEFQRGRAVSFEYYVEFWDDNDVEVGAIELVSADSEQAIVRLELFLNGADDPLDDELTLRAGDAGRLLIASERSLD